MPRHPIAKRGFAAALLALFALAPAVPAHADGVIQITQAKVLAGNITPGDTPGYPVTLSKPGSYKLAGNLAVSAGRSGIHITAPDVTVDLNGFRIHGLDKATNGIEGTKNGATIRNGTIEHFKNDGVYVSGRYAIVVDMRLLSNGRAGIEAGDEAHVRSTTSVKNDVGVLCQQRCRIEQTTATSNRYDGIVCDLSCHAEGNVASYNGQFGIYLNDGLALANTVSRNGGVGILGGGATSAVYGNNVLTGNNQGNAQAASVGSLHANFCYPGACP